MSNQEPFGYFRFDAFSWTDCAERDEGAIPLYEHPQPNTDGEGMSKQDALRTIKLLSAIESVMLAAQQRIPDYLLEELALVMETLEKIVLTEAQ